MRTDRYYTYALMTELLQGWVAAYPGLASLGSIGQSREGREIWVVTLTNRAPGPGGAAGYARANAAVAVRYSGGGSCAAPPFPGSRLCPTLVPSSPDKSSARSR